MCEAATYMYQAPPQTEHFMHIARCAPTQELSLILGAYMYALHIIIIHTPLDISFDESFPYYYQGSGRM